MEKSSYQGLKVWQKAMDLTAVLWEPLKTLNVMLNLFQHLLKFRRLRVMPAMTGALQKGFLEVPLYQLVKKLPKELSKNKYFKKLREPLRVLRVALCNNDAVLHRVTRRTREVPQRQNLSSLFINTSKGKLYALSDQMRRATVSITSNIAEGHDRNRQNAYFPHKQAKRSVAGKPKTET